MIAFALAYTITYSAIEVDSPSLVMLLEVAKRGEAGMATEEFHTHFSDKLLVDPRVADMLRDGLAVARGEQIVITAKGRAFVRIFIGFRAILGAGKEDRKP